MLRVAVLKTRSGERPTVIVKEFPWRQESASLQTAAGADELTKALRKASEEFGLAAATIFVAVSGDYCVTRVVTGPEEKVKAEIAGLEKRSRLYLSLGQGPKAIGGSIQQVDARHQHALLTVINQQTLQTLVDVTQRLGLDVECIEPSLVSISRLLGRLEGDATGPALIASFGERGLEVGISHRGQLLLDYRPAGQEDAAAATEIVIRHLVRLQRYCDRYVRLSNGALRTVYLSGGEQETTAAQDAFLADGRVLVEMLDDTERVGEWRIEGDRGANTAAVVGAMLKADPAAPQHDTPNLREGLARHSARSLGRDLLATCWPLAASLLIAVMGGWWIAGVQQRTARINAQHAALEDRQAEANVTALVVARDVKKLDYVRRVADFANHLAVDRLLENVAGCQPDDVWLDSISIDGVATMSVSGASYSDEGVYELMKTMRACPAFRDVALTGTQAARDREGPVTRFEVRVEIAESARPAPEPARPRQTAAALQQAAMAVK